MMEEPIIDVRDVTFAYGAVNVLENVSLAVNRGEFLGLVGPNGSGKSTLIKVILGLEQPQSGDIRLFGKPSSQFRAWSRIGYVSQKANRFNTSFPATVFEVVSTGLYGKLGLFKRLSRQDRRVVYDMMDRVGLSTYHKHLMGELSGGQQQRVFIARALVSQPDLLILDEPTVGIDAESVDRFYRLLEDLRNEYDLTILLVSHDIGVMTAKVSSVACLNKQVHYHGDPEAFNARQDEILSRTYGHDVRMLEHSH
jgi:zinc transport system ATP-binding protein